MSNDSTESLHHIELSGEYDIARKQELAAAFALVTNGSPVTIDMSRVTYVDSTFLGELAAMKTRHAERCITLIGTQPNVVRIMQITQLDRLFVFREM
jgi:anti-anti-sigma factor